MNMYQRLCVLLSVCFAVLTASAGQPDNANPLGDFIEDNREFDRRYGDVHVLAVGVNKYAEHTPMGDLRFAINDATELAALLKRHYNYNTKVLTNEKASSSGIYQAITTIANGMGDDDVFIFFFAGHGATHQYTDEDGQAQKTGLIIPYITEDLNGIPLSEVRDEILKANPYNKIEQDDGESDEDYQLALKRRRADWERAVRSAEASMRVPDYSIDMQDLRDRIMSIPGKHKLMLFDSCFSGFATASTRATLTPTEFDEFSKNLSRWNRLENKSFYAMTAGSNTQEVIEHTGDSRGAVHIEAGTFPGTPIRHGVFTYELLSNLKQLRKGEAISVNELWSQVQADVGVTLFKMGDQYVMHPQVRDLIGSGGAGEFVFVADPTSKWLANIRSGLGSETMKPDEIQDAIKRSSEKAEMARQERLDQEKLESEAMLVYMSRKAQRAGLQDASELENDPDLEAKFIATRQRAASGDETAMATLAYMHAYGLGTKRDTKEASAWAVEAKGEGIAHASLVLSELLQNGYANELNIEGIEQLDQQLLQEQTQQTQAAGGIAILLAAQSSNDSTVRGLGAVIGVGIAAQSFFKNAEPQSYEAALAEIDVNMQQLALFAEDINDLDTEKANNDFEKLKATLLVQISSLEDNGLNNHNRRKGRGKNAELRYPRRNMAFRAANKLLRGINELDEPKTNSEVSAYISALESLELPYCQMIALSDYLAGRREWTRN